MLRSGNDAALVIAKYVGGSVANFVDMMNNKASEIGMKNSTFNNPHGLDIDKGNYSTAYDMAILTSYAMKLNEYRIITKTKSYKLKTNKNTYLWKNKNKLLKLYKYTTGGKTGFTDIARRTLVTTASFNNINLVCVTLNDGNDFLDHKSLFEYGFANYTNLEIIKKGNVSIYDEYYNDYELYTDVDFNYIVNNKEDVDVVLKYELEKKRDFSDGDIVGNLIVIFNGSEVHRQNIFVRVNKKNKTGFFDKIKNWFKNIF